MPSRPSVAQSLPIQMSTSARGPSSTQTQPDTAPDRPIQLPEYLALTAAGWTGDDLIHSGAPTRMDQSGLLSGGGALRRMQLDEMRDGDGRQDSGWAGAYLDEGSVSLGGGAAKSSNMGGSKTEANSMDIKTNKRNATDTTKTTQPPAKRARVRSTSKLAPPAQPSHIGSHALPPTPAPTPSACSPGSLDLSPGLFDFTAFGPPPTALPSPLTTPSTRTYSPGLGRLVIPPAAPPAHQPIPGQVHVAIAGLPSGVNVGGLTVSLAFGQDLFFPQQPAFGATIIPTRLPDGAGASGGHGKTSDWKPYDRRAVRLFVTASGRVVTAGRFDEEGRYSEPDLGMLRKAWEATGAVREI